MANDRYLRVKTNITGPPAITQEIIPLEHLQHIENTTSTQITFEYFKEHSGSNPNIIATLNTVNQVQVQQIIQAIQDIFATQNQNPIGVFDVASVVPGIQITNWTVNF